MAVTADSPIDKAGLVLGLCLCNSPASVTPASDLGGGAKLCGELALYGDKVNAWCVPLSRPSSLISWSLFLSFSG